MSPPLDVKHSQSVKHDRPCIMFAPSFIISALIRCLGINPPHSLTLLPYPLHLTSVLKIQNLTWYTPCSLPLLLLPLLAF
jgi:hypothetical protein